MTMLKKKMQMMNETLLDLIIGCLVHSMIFELAGLIFVQDKIAWSLGLALGTCTAVGMCISMYMGISDCLSRDQTSAQRTMTIQSVLRLLVMMAAAWLGIKFRQLSFPAVIVGILGLKVSAHLHMYTNVYITKKIRRKGR